MRFPAELKVINSDFVELSQNAVLTALPRPQLR